MLSIEPDTMIYTPEQSLIWGAGGQLFCVRDGEKQWPAPAGAPFDETQPTYSSLDAFLAAKKPVWWEIKFALPRMLFAAASVRFHEGRGGYAETFGAAHSRFLKEVVTPFVEKWGLEKAPDQLPRVYLYGTAGSPARKTAEQQFREMEADVRKWSALVWDAPEGEERKRYAALWERYCKAYTAENPGPPRPGRPSAFEPRGAAAARAERPSGDSLKQLLVAYGAGQQFLIDPEEPRAILVIDSTGDRIGRAICLSDTMVFASIDYKEGGRSSHYMPLRHFLEIYSV